MTSHSIYELWLKYKACVFSAVIPIAILLLADAFFGIYPFGEHSPLALDLNAQYVYYYEYMYDVFAGKESIFYSWSRSLSGEFIGLFAYYLASPFNLIIWLFPRESVTEGILVMQLAKAAAVGLTSAFYLKKQRGSSDLTTVIFSASFAMCGYFAAHTINPMWLDGLIALPLVLAGVERVCGKRRFLLYTLSLVYIFIANYYIGYMVGIFSALYFLYYLLSKRSSVSGVKDVIKAVTVYGVSSVSAILISCPIIIPVYKSLSVGKLVYGDPGYSLRDNLENPRENFNIADIFIKLFPGTYDTIRPEGLPMLYCGTFALIFAALYFLSRKIPLRQRISGGVLLGVMVISMYVMPVDMLWHGGQVPVWMPFRYSFEITFMLVIFGAEAFEQFSSGKSKRVREIGSVFALLLGVLLYSDYYGGNEYYDTTLVILIPIICLAVFTIMIVCFARTDHGIKRKITGCAAAGLVCAELLLNAVVTFNKAHDDIWYSSRESYTDIIPPTRGVMDEIRERDKGFYRSEKTYHRTVNDPAAVGMYGISHSSSTYNAKVIELLRKIGYGARDHYTRYDGATMLTDDIFGFKYVLSKNPDLVPYYETVLEKGDIKAYENIDAFPLAYLADIGVIGSELASEDPFAAQTSLARLISGKNYELYYPITDMMFDSLNVSIGSTTDAHISYKKRDTNSRAYISYNVIMPHKGKAYVYFPTYYERECALYVNDKYSKNYFESENHTIAYLGSYEAGENFNVRLELYKEDLYFTEAMFFYLDEDELADFSRSVWEMNSNTVVERTGHSGLEITVNAGKDSALFMTIPMEEGWSAVIDGEEAQLVPAVDNTLMAIRVPAGEHRITVSFFPAGLKNGLIMMAVGLVIFAVMLVIPKLINLKPRDEGEFFGYFDGYADEELPDFNENKINNNDDNGGNDNGQF